MKKFFLISVTILTALLSTSAGICLAEKAYVTDSFNVTFRSGPSTDHKIIRMLDSGQQVEALRSESGWTLVRLLSGSDEAIEGWVLERYLISRPPWKMQAGALKAENETLKKKLASVEGDWKGLKEEAERWQTELAGSRKELEKLQQEYERLKSGASEYLKLKREHSDMKAGFEANREKLQHLAEENRELRSAERTKWFATGAVVLLFGLVIGLILGRREKKRRSLYY
jgi:SH3 domain protein